MGMPPSVAAIKLPITSRGAMKKRHSHSLMERFSTDCCVKNTKLPRVCSDRDAALSTAFPSKKILLNNNRLIDVTRWRERRSQALIVAPPRRFGPPLTAGAHRATAPVRVPRRVFRWDFLRIGNRPPTDNSPHSTRTSAARTGICTSRVHSCIQVSAEPHVHAAELI